MGLSAEAHQARQVAESFGSDPERYDRTRPRYPQALIERILAASPGPDVLDVGCGTGVASRQLQAAGARVLGVEVDPRMAEFARHAGLDVEVAKFEDWDPASRRFDAVVAGTTWHWVDPVAGAGKAAQVLAPGGRLAAFWNVQQPPLQLARAFAEVYREVLPGTPFSRGLTEGLEAYDGFLTRAAGGIAEAGAFDAPERWRFDWERPYTREQWLDLLPTFGGHSRFAPGTLQALAAGIGDAIDAAGGDFTMGYAAVVITARRAAD